MIAVLHMQWCVTIGINAFTQQTESVSLWQKASAACVREENMMYCEAWCYRLHFACEISIEHTEL